MGEPLVSTTRQGTKDTGSEDTGKFPFEGWEFTLPTDPTPTVTLRSPWKLAATLLISPVPPGVVLEYGGTTAPTGFLMCDGASYLRLDYAGLFNIIGTTFGFVDGTHFNVPDHREAAGAGVGTRGVGVTDHDIYNLGDFKDDQVQDHTHSIPLGGAGVTTTGPGAWAGLFNSFSSYGPNSGRHGTTTRGKRLGMNFIIKT